MSVVQWNPAIQCLAISKQNKTEKPKVLGRWKQDAQYGVQGSSWLVMSLRTVWSTQDPVSNNKVCQGDLYDGRGEFPTYIKACANTTTIRVKLMTISYCTRLMNPTLP